MTFVYVASSSEAHRPARFSWAEEGGRRFFRIPATPGSRGSPAPSPALLAPPESRNQKLGFVSHPERDSRVNWRVLPDERVRVRSTADRGPSQTFKVRLAAPRFVVEQRAPEWSGGIAGNPARTTGNAGGLLPQRCLLTSRIRNNLETPETAANARLLLRLTLRRRRERHGQLLELKRVHELFLSSKK